VAQQALQDCQDRYRALQAQLAQLGFLSRGSVLRLYTTCGKPGCRCQADPPQRHGPYWQWTRKVKGKTVTRHLAEREAQLYLQWIANARRLDSIIAEMLEVSSKAAELLLHEEPEKSPIGS
jgi:hypothetical protein